MVRTVHNVAIANLSQNFRPHCSMDLLVLIDELRLQLDDLRKAPAWVMDFRSREIPPWTKRLGW
jgi:hypothetical protein